MPRRPRRRGWVSQDRQVEASGTDLLLSPDRNPATLARGSGPTLCGHVRRKRHRNRLEESRHRPLASWSLHDTIAVLAIEELLPYLVVKRREAELLLRLRSLKS